MKRYKLGTRKIRLETGETVHEYDSMVESELGDYCRFEDHKRAIAGVDPASIANRERELLAQLESALAGESAALEEAATATKYANEIFDAFKSFRENAGEALLDENRKLRGRWETLRGWMHSTTFRDVVTVGNIADKMRKLEADDE